jgi:hypothetical protein
MGKNTVERETTTAKGKAKAKGCTWSKYERTEMGGVSFWKERENMVFR